MATTTTVITDLPDGSIKVVSDYHPRPGDKCTLAQEATLKILARTRIEYGLKEPATTKPALATIDPSSLTPGQPAPTCEKCGRNNQVWVNQITQRLTCHRVGCHTTTETISHHPV